MAWGGARPGAGRKGPNVSRETPTAPAAVAKPMTLSTNFINQIIEASNTHAKQSARSPEMNPFQLPKFPAKAIPPKAKQMAMDDSMNWASTQWAGGMLGSFAAEGMLFLGYPYLAELAQRPEYRVISETIATEMTRKWIKFKGTGDDDVSDKIKQLVDFLDAIECRDRYAELAAQDGFFGRSHLFHDFGDDLDTDPAELATPIGNGRDATSKGKINQKRPLRGIRTIEPVWTYPMTYNATNPLKNDWYNPQHWYVMGKEIHCSRLLTFIGRPVPDLLKPAYAFGGLSLSQMAKPYVDIWLTTRQSIADLIHSFSVMVLMTDLQTILQPGSANGLIARAALFNALRDNQGLMIVNKATEDFKNVSASMAGLHELQAQSQEHMASVARIPLVKFTGISPTGLNASSEGEMRAFYDTIAAFQNRFFRPHLTKTIDFAMLSLWGEVDQAITYEFEPLWELSEKERGEKRKAEAETAQIDIDSGAIAPAERRQVLVDDPDSPYQGLDPEDVPDLAAEEEEGLGVEHADPDVVEPDDGGKGGEGGGQDRAILPFDHAADAAFNEADHPRATNGQFGTGGTAAKALQAAAPSLKHFKHIEPRGERYRHGRTYAADPHYHIMASTELHPAQQGSKNAPNPITLAGHESATGIALKVNPQTKHIYFSELNSHIKGAGKAMVEAIVKQYPDYTFSVTDWSQATEANPKGPSFWSKIKAKYPKQFGEDGAMDAGWSESDHPRGQPGNAGQFGSGGGSKAKGGGTSSAAHDPVSKAAPINVANLAKVGPQMGSNPGGVYGTPSGKKFYIKESKSAAHTQNELTAAKLFALTGSPTLKYQPVEGGMHVATELQKLDANNVSKLTTEERKQAQSDFVTHAWLANWDAAGTGGDNIGSIKGKAIPLDFGGALAYRAQGAPKTNFGTEVFEIQSMNNPHSSPDNAALYGDMTPEEMKASAQRVVNISDDEIRDAIGPGKGTKELADKMIARKNDIAKQFNLEFEGKHARGPGGKFAKMADKNLDEVSNGTATLIDSLENPVTGTAAEILKTSDGFVVTEMEEGEALDAIFYETKAEAFAKAKALTGGEQDPDVSPPPKPESSPAPTSFKSKKDQAAHLLSQGVTTKEMLTALGWPSISMPAMAKSLGMKLEKIKEGGVTKYKGTPMNAAEKAEAKVAPKAAKEIPPAAAPAKAAPISKATPQELEKAKKGTKVPMNANEEGNKLISAFNKKYENKTITHPDLLEQKVADFKTMKAKLDAIAAAGAAAQAEAHQKAAKAQKAKEAAEAAEAAEKNKSVMADLGISEVEALGFNALVKMMGGSKADVVKTFQKYENEAKGYGYPITGFQCALIKNYTDGGYHQINPALRTGKSWTADQHVYVKMVNKALKAMPTYTGVTKRGTDLSSEKQKDYTVGNVVEESAFTSTSPTNPWGGNTKFTITAIGQRGAHVKKLSSHGSENEVVFAARTFFQVTKVEGKPGGQMHVHMTEVEHE